MSLPNEKDDCTHYDLIDLTPLNPIIIDSQNIGQNDSSNGIDIGNTGTGNSNTSESNSCNSSDGYAYVVDNRKPTSTARVISTITPVTSPIKNFVKKKQQKEQQIIKKSPLERYVCYNDIIGRGAYKVVYRGYDTHLGIEVAWNSIKLEHLNDYDVNLIIDEVMLLKELSPQNVYILNFFNAWLDEENQEIVFITELALSGTLKEYILKIETIRLRVIKKWCLQILDGISFLHSQSIAHRDLKCNNIFINSNTGMISIGDFGLAKQRSTNLHSVIGTPEYMAPEMFDEKYDEKVDIYAFGMCLLEMVTKEVPYSECKAIGQIYKNIVGGIPPVAVEKIKNEKTKQLVCRCIAFDPKMRPNAKELLEDPFFLITNEDNDENLVKTPSKKDSVDIDDPENQIITHTRKPIHSIRPHEDTDNNMDEPETKPLPPPSSRANDDKIKELINVNLENFRQEPL